MAVADRDELWEVECQCSDGVVRSRSCPSRYTRSRYASTARSRASISSMSVHAGRLASLFTVIPAVAARHRRRFSGVRYVWRGHQPAGHRGRAC